VLFSYGERTEVEVKEAALNYNSAVNRTYSAAIDLIKAVGELQLLYPGV